MPRIDYLTEIGKAKELQKPSLLLEPQSTNTATYSNNFTLGDIFTSSGNPNQNNSVITPKKTNSPDNTNDGWELRDNGDGVFGAAQLAYYSTTVVSGDTNTFSVFLKKGSTDLGYIITGGFDASANGTSYFNLSTGTLSNTSTNHSDVRMVDYGNGWYRCSITITTTTDVVGSFTVGMATSTSIQITRDGSNFLYMFGIQAETVGYSTSYIPTSGSTVTRNAESCNNAGQLGVFNDTEGVLYAEMAALADDLTFRSISINDNTSNEAVVIRFRTNTNRINGLIRDGGSAVNNLNFDVTDITDFHKVAYKFKTGECALYIDGTQVATGTSTFTLSPLTNLNFDNGVGDFFYGKVREVKAFRRALTDSELTELTNNIT